MNAAAVLVRSCLPKVSPHDGLRNCFPVNTSLKFATRRLMEFQYEHARNSRSHTHTPSFTGDDGLQSVVRALSRGQVAPHTHRISCFKLFPFGHWFVSDLREDGEEILLLAVLRVRSPLDTLLLDLKLLRGHWRSKF
jgi:hypothetical protein